MMRLFVGLEPSPAFRSALAALQDQLRSAGVRARYCDPSYLHLTLAFIGMWPENITAILPPVGRPFSIWLSRPGVFPEANVLWAGVRPSPALDGLARRVRQILDEAGIPFDRKPFYPHITLGRKPIVPAHVLLSEMEVPAIAMTVRELCLYRSAPGENGTAYTAIGRSGKNRG